MFGKAKCPEPIEYDHALQAVSKIFDVMLWRKQIPPCFLTWIRNNLREQIWQLRVIPFSPIICNSKVESNGIQDIRYYECGFDIPKTGYSMGGFKHKTIGKGGHDNLHKVIHCLNREGIDYDNMEIEEWFDGYKVDILARTNEKKVIVVELGELDKIGKFSFPDDEDVKEFWFGDRDKFIYSLSRKAPRTEQTLREEGRKYKPHFLNYFQKYCDKNRLYYHCKSYYSAYNCFDVTRTLDF